MTTPTKKLGIWMDHSIANPMEFTSTPLAATSIASITISEGSGHGQGKNENLMHNKEQHQQTDYYKQIKDVLKNYDEVILFGPSTAKNELANLLKEDHVFEKMKVEVKDADKMTENQQHAFVRDHFSKSQHSV